MKSLDIIVALFFAALFIWRLRLFSFRRIFPTTHISKKVSIIVPCRNEEDNISLLLESLKALPQEKLEIIVVDDHSTDQTAAIARRHGVLVLQAPERPPGWTGKNWPCWVGAQQAQGEFLLFTDADTIHRPDSLGKALTWMQTADASMISAPPFHQAKLWWEKGLGFFHVLPLLITNYLGEPRPRRLFAIGQYLLFSRDAYFRMGGHHAIANSLVDDIDLARRCLEQGFKYGVYPHHDLFEVQMYQSFKDFFAGWTRLIRLGFPRSQLITVVEVTGVFYFVSTVFLKPWLLYTAMGFLLLALAQKNKGEFPMWGVLFAPLAAILFCVLTLKAQLDVLFQQKIIWRGRTYLSLFLFTGIVSFASQSLGSNIKLHIKGLRSSNGGVAVSLFHQEHARSFPSAADKAYRTQYVELKEGQQELTIEFTDIAPGTYALALLHDENGDRTYNANFIGIPKEGFGFSQNPKIFMGAPGFSKCSFVLNDSDQAQNIQMKYML